MARTGRHVATDVLAFLLLSLVPSLVWEAGAWQFSVSLHLLALLLRIGMCWAICLLAGVR